MGEVGHGCQLVLLILGGLREDLYVPITEYINFSKGLFSFGFETDSVLSWS